MPEKPTALQASRGRSSIGVERVAYPLEARFAIVDAVDGHDVETQRQLAPFRPRHEQMTRSANQTCAFIGTDALRRTDEATAGASANFDDDQASAVRADEIELSEAAAVAREQDAQATSAQVGLRASFPAEAFV